MCMVPLSIKHPTITATIPPVIKTKTSFMVFSFDTKLVRVLGIKIL